jgi:hypothetical protein
MHEYEAVTAYEKDNEDIAWQRRKIIATVSIGESLFICRPEMKLILLDAHVARPFRK